MDDYQINQQYYAGDHWKTWIGPQVRGSDLEAHRVMREVERVFQDCNKIKECVNRHRRALTAKRPRFKVLADGESKEDAAIAALMSRWLGYALPRSARPRPQDRDEDKVVLPHAIAEAVHDRLLGGVGYLRLWLPERLQKFPEHRRVALHSPPPTSVEVLEDDEGFPIEYRYHFTRDDQPMVEIQQINEQGQTVFWVDVAGNAAPDQRSTPGDEAKPERLNLGGRFTIARLRGSPLITKPIRRKQDGLNFILTMMIRNLQFGGFLRDVIINGMPPGEFDENGQFLPDPEGWVEGMGEKLEVAGVPIFDPQTGAVVGYSTPSVQTREPVNVETFLKGIQAVCALLYEEFGQGHILASDIALSGVSRQQLRQDFVLACGEDASDVAVQLSDLFGAAYALMRKGSPPTLEFDVQLQLSISEKTPDELNGIAALFNADLRSQRTAMAETGIENPDAEIEQIEAEKERRMQAMQPDIEELLKGGAANHDDGDEDDDDTDDDDDT